MNPFKMFATKQSMPGTMLPGDAAGIARRTATVAAKIPAAQAMVQAGLAEADDLVKQASAAIAAGHFISGASLTKRAAKLRSLCRQTTREIAAFSKKYEAAQAFAASLNATSNSKGN